MNSRIDETLAPLLTRLVDFARHRAMLVIVACGLVSVLAAGYAAMNLGINSDNVQLLAPDLPSRLNQEAFARIFPNLENALLVVVDAETPELARSGATILIERLNGEPEQFEHAYPAGGGAFFETHGLLYRSPDELDVFADQMARLQPIIATLEQDPSIANLASLVAAGLEQAANGDGEALAPEDWSLILDSVGDATVAVYTEFPLALSWEQLLLSGSAIDVAKRHIIVVHPVLDFGSFLAAGRAMERIREIALEEGLDPDHGTTIRITGNPALNYEEMIGLAWDIGGSSIFCFLLVVSVLTRALRSFRLVLAAVVTLLVGLIWTAGFAALTVGHLSLVSASFAVLFIGLGVDFGIHLGMAYAAAIRGGAPNDVALRVAAESVGSSLVLCTVTTVIGFFVFIPTDYLGVAELGWIAGSGMFLILFLTLTLMPALLSRVFLVEASQIQSELHFRSTWWRVFEQRAGLVVVVAVMLLVAGGALLPRARFDVNVVDMRDPTTESVQTFNDLLAQAGAMSPWYIDSVVGGIDAIPARVAELQALDSVSHTISILDYVPADQDQKLELLGDLGYLLDTPPRSPSTDRAPSLGEQIAALRQLYELLGDDSLGQSHSQLIASMRLLRARLAEFLGRVDEDRDPAGAIQKLDELLMSGFPDQIARLKAAVETDAITLESLPGDLVERMVAKDGRARIQVFPKDDLSNEQAFTRFTDEVMAVDPQAAGVAVNLVGFGRATRDSLRQALISAVVLITLLLFALWRRVLPVALVLAPLLLSSVLVVALMALFDIPFNFANVVVIPLLLGIGVDSGIHLVHRSEVTQGTDDDLMDSTTARSVFYSAVTTVISFGTLAFSSHRGVASLGIVLTVGMVITVLSNLIVLPALIKLAGRGTDA